MFKYDDDTMPKQVRGRERNLIPSSKHDKSTGLYNGKSINKIFNCLSTFKKDDVTSVRLQSNFRSWPNLVKYPHDYFLVHYQLSIKL